MFSSIIKTSATTVRNFGGAFGAVVDVSFLGSVDSDSGAITEEGAVGIEGKGPSSKRIPGDSSGLARTMDNALSCWVTRALIRSPNSKDSDNWVCGVTSI